MFQGPPSRAIGWFFAFNAVNYSFWPELNKERWHTEISGKLHGTDDEAFGIMAAFTRAMNQGIALDEAEVLLKLDLVELERILYPAPNAGSLPLLSSRLEALHELGEAYSRLGGPMGLIDEGRGSATQLVQSIAHHLPTWDDSRVHAGQRLRFLKRAQLCVAMIFGRFGGQAPGDFDSIGQLTAFADYRLPQILRHLGILRLAPPLTAAIDAKTEITRGSPEEVELRCASIVAVDRLHRALQHSWPSITPLHVDYLLWRSAVSSEAELPEHHRCRCTDY